MKILVAVLSCNKNSHLWKKIQNLDISNLCIFTGGSETTYYDKDSQVLHLRCNDGYDGLPEKMILMIEYILYAEQFSDVTHIIKIDDHDNTFTKKNIENLYHLKELKKYHYIGQRLNNNSSYPWHWLEGNKWHIGKVSDKSYWYNKYYNGGYVPWLDGGCSYILSREAMKCIHSWYNSSNLETLRKREIFEDVMMAKILYHHNIYPKQVNYGIIGDK